MCFITMVFQTLCSLEVFATVVTLYKDFSYKIWSFHFIRRLFIHSFFYKNILRFVIFSNTTSITSEAFVLLVKFLSSVFSTETWLDLSRQYLFLLASSLLIWFGHFFLTGQVLLYSSLLLNWKASMPTESLNRNLLSQ